MLGVVCELERATGCWMWRDNCFVVEVAALYLTLHNVDGRMNVQVCAENDSHGGLIEALFRYLPRGSRKP